MQFSLPEDILRCNDLVTCFQSLYNLLFAILLALAFLYFLWGAFEYLLSGIRVASIESGKRKMINSIIAVIIVLIIPMILNVINPQIFQGIELSIPKIIAKVPEISIFAPETPEEDRLPAGTKVIDYPPDQNLLNLLKNKNIQFISKMVVDCVSKKMKIYDENNNYITEIDINVAKKGCNDKNISGSRTTPKGTFPITSKMYNPKGFRSRELGSYMETRLIVYYSPRELYIHGGKGERLAPTAGCIRVRDSELAAIYNFIKPQKTKLIIQ